MGAVKTAILFLQKILLFFFIRPERPTRRKGLLVSQVNARSALTKVRVSARRQREALSPSPHVISPCPPELKHAEGMQLLYLLLHENEWEPMTNCLAEVDDERVALVIHLRPPRLRSTRFKLSENI